MSPFSQLHTQWPLFWCFRSNFPTKSSNCKTFCKLQGNLKNKMLKLPGFCAISNLTNTPFQICHPMTLIWRVRSVGAPRHSYMWVHPPPPWPSDYSCPRLLPPPIFAEQTVWEIQLNWPYSDWHSRFWTRHQGHYQTCCTIGQSAATND